jgi:hypothetical protein
MTLFSNHKYADIALSYSQAHTFKSHLLNESDIKKEEEDIEEDEGEKEEEKVVEEEEEEEEEEKYYIRIMGH